MRKMSGFTIVELLVTIIVISILAAITIVSYGAWQRNIADSSLQAEVSQATSSLGQFKNFKSNYPPNLAGTGYVSAPNVALVLLTNAPSIGVYSSLSPDQNATLLLNVCNANLENLYNTVCQFQGNGGGAKIHVKGTNATNINWSSPISQSTITGTMSPNGSDYSAAANAIITQFTAQGGTFPVVVSGSSSNVSLPTPDQVPSGPADTFCLQGTSTDFPDIRYYTTSQNSTLVAGSCPATTPPLQYYP